MHELVIVLCDFYVSQETPDRELPAGVTLPGLGHAARLGARSKIAGGWRAWLGRWLTGKDCGAPATVAALAAAASSAPAASTANAPATAANSPPRATPTDSIAALAPMASPIAWMATPMHLIAGHTSVHVDRRSILRLDASDQAALAADFQRVFHDSGFHLQPLDAGDFLMLGPPTPLPETSEPARSMGASMADAQRADAAIPALRRLGGEIEMWLHDHPVNDARARRREPPVTALWLWGGGPVASSGNVGAAASDHATAAITGVATNATTDAAIAATIGDSSPDIAFGRDSYLQGLWTAARGAKVFPLPPQLADVFGYPRARRAVLVIEIGEMLQSNPTWTFFDAVAQIDRAFIAPAVEALNRGRCEQLVILANDHQLTLRARDRLKFWRRTPSGLSGLQ